MSGAEKASSRGLRHGDHMSLSLCLLVLIVNCISFYDTFSLSSYILGSLVVPVILSLITEKLSSSEKFGMFGLLP